MNCEDFESNVAELAREQMMEASVLAQALAHNEECEACAQRLDDQRSLSFKLSALARETNSADLPPMGNELLTRATRPEGSDRPVSDSCVQTLSGNGGRRYGSGCDGFGCDCGNGYPFPLGIADCANAAEFNKP